jgi:HAD superfamily hydrolase (TIGR01509 family)
MTIRAIAWDVDGTLVDSEPLHLRSLQHVCAAYSVDIADLPDETFVGLHILDVWAVLQPRFSGQVTRADWLDLLNAYFVTNAATVASTPGAFEVVAHFASVGILQCAVSNSNRVVVNANLEAADLSQFMMFTISLDDVVRGKPDPEPYRRALSALGSSPQETLAVEDSETGLTAATAAGMVTVAYGSAVATSANARYHIRDLGELKDIFPLPSAMLEGVLNAP